MSGLQLNHDPLGTELEGYFEFSGKRFYGTGAKRMLLPAKHVLRNGANQVGINAAGSQIVFDNASFNAEAGVTYEYELIYTLTKTVGATAHNFSIGFDGTATFNNVLRHILAGAVGSAATSAAAVNLLGYAASMSAVQIAAAITSAAANVWVREKGTFSVLAAGTIRPFYNLSAAPGGTYTTLPGGLFEVVPLADASDVSVGAFV